MISLITSFALVNLSSKVCLRKGIIKFSGYVRSTLYDAVAKCFASETDFDNSRRKSYEKEKTVKPSPK